MYRIFNAQAVMPDGILDGAAIDCLNGRIAEVSPSVEPGDIDLESCYLLPGLIDVHTHPPLENAANPRTLLSLCQDLRAHGAAGFLFATGNIAVTNLCERLRSLHTILDQVGPNAGCLGIHLEGPYVSFEGRGGFQPNAIANPQELPVEDLLDACGPWAKYINIAPELPGALDAIRKCRARGLAVSIGHTRARRDTIDAAVKAGANAVCHIFNASEIQRFKEPGVFDMTVDLLGLVSDELVCELICDGIHVDPYLVCLLYRAKGPEGIALITDSLLGGRMAEEGQTIHGELTDYRVTNGAARNPAGELCGSTLSMAQAVRNFAAILSEQGHGNPSIETVLSAAVRAAAYTPARLLRLENDYGSIEPGRRALFCVLDSNLAIREDLCRRVNATHR